MPVEIVYDQKKTETAVIVRIPAESGHRIRTNPNTESG